LEVSLSKVRESISKTKENIKVWGYHSSVNGKALDSSPRATHTHKEMERKKLDGLN
jgi:hypothetical protein